MERFSGYDGILNDGIVNGNCGCTASHRALLEIIAYNKWPRVPVLEDDFEFIHDDFHNKFESMAKLVPDNWDMFYLGGHYAEAPVARVNATHQNGPDVHHQHAASPMALPARCPVISGSGRSHPGTAGSTPEQLLHPPTPAGGVYPGMSDLTGQHNTNEHCMLDTRHENMV